MVNLQKWWVPLLLILLQAGIAIHAARHLSPTWDEIAYPAAGLAQLKTGELTLNTVNPFLSKLIYAAPLLFLNPPLPLDSTAWKKKDEYRLGFLFTFRNSYAAQTLIFLSRLPPIFLSCLLMVLLYQWMRSLWSETAGAITLLLYLGTPVFLSRASLAQLEMPMYFLMLSALWCHHQWFETGRLSYLMWSGFITGLALLCKLAALPLIPTFILLNLLFHPKNPPYRFRIGAIGILIIVPFLTIALGTLPWKGGALAFIQMIRNLFTFDTILPFYWAGETRINTHSFISWAALLLKAPLAVLTFGIAGGLFWLKSKQNRGAFLHFFFLSLISLCGPFFFRNAVSTIQLSPFYLGIVALAGGWVIPFQKKKRWIILPGIVFLAGSTDIFFVHPNYGAYFNALAGGSNKGFHWLADSDQDWGQSLPALAELLKAQGSPFLILAYSGSGDPAAYGIQYQDLLSPALVTRERRDAPLSLDTKKIYLAVGTKVLQSEPLYFDWLLNNEEPMAVAGQTFFVYDISNKPKAFNWMEGIYRETGRPAQALWCSRRARQPFSSLLK